MPAAPDADSRSALSALDVDLDSLDDDEQFMDAMSDVDLSEFDDSGFIEELGSLDEIAGLDKPVEPAPAVSVRVEPQHAEPARREPREESPYALGVRPLAYETEVYQPVYPTNATAYDDESYAGGYANPYANEVLYEIPETIVPSTFANVKPITGGVPTDHYLSRKRRRRRKLISTIILLIFIAVALGFAYYTWDQEMWGGKRIPALVGMTEEEARSALMVKALDVEVDPVPSDAGFGIVLGSDPAEGERCASDQPVVLQIASQRKIPNVVGLAADDARAALTDEGATNIVITYANSTAAEGTVISVDPAPESTFISTDPITITIAQPYTVPEVVGMSITDAQAAVAAAGLRSQVEYVQSWATRDTIVSVSPEAGTRVEENATVTLYAPIPYPSTVYELGYYYRITPEQVSEYLNYLNYTLEQGGTYTTGEGYERWVGATSDIISFTNEPESKTGPAGNKDVLAEGTKWTAVRYQSAKGSAATQLEVNENNARTIAKACGLGGEVVDVCTQEDITTPYSINREAYDFVCIQGEWGDYVWVVLISRGKSVTNTITTPTTKTETSVDENGVTTQTTTTTNITTTSVTPADKESTVIVALMPEETTNVSGLASYGNSFCDYFAYANLYSSNR